MASVTVWADIVHLGRRAARVFGLRMPRFEPYPRRRNLTIDGSCRANGLIRIRVHRHGRPRQALSVATIMATLAHELAHLPRGRRPQLWHTAEHGNLTRRIADWLRKQGQPVSRILHSSSYVAGVPRSPARALYKRAWKRPKPRRKARRQPRR